MTVTEFRRLALRFPETREQVHIGHPDFRVAVKGAWGRRGCTNVRLSKAKAAAVRGALIAAWLNTAPKRLAQAFETTK